jgi:hypothetical protein
MFRFKMLILLFFVLSPIRTYSQVPIKGILENPYKSFKTGDTIIFAGATETGNNNNLHYILKSTNELIPADKVYLLLDEIDFWDIQQFYYISYDIITKGWQVDRRKELEQKTLSFLARLESDNKLYNDKFAEDYLQRLIQKIHYPEFSKGREQFLNVKILNTDKKVCYAFDNGTILISTELIANIENEKQLFRILTESVAHILLNTNMSNAEAGSKSELQQLGAIYPENTKKRIRLIAEKYVSYYEKNTAAEPYSPQIYFFNSIAGVISYTAWQDFYSQKYRKALLNINKLVGYDIANSTDYLLIAKIFLKLSDTAEANQKAMGYLKKATEFEDQPLPEVYSEMGILQLRVQQYEQAKESFKKYYEMAVTSKDKEEQQWALKMINACNVFMNLKETRFRPADSLDVSIIQIVE